MISSAEQLLDLTRKKGITDVEIYQVESYAHPISFEANRLKQIEISQTQGLALQLWHEHRPGLVVAYGDFVPEDLINKAVAIAQLNEAEQVLLNSNQKLVYPHKATEPNLQTLIEQGKNAIATIKDHNPEVIVNLELEWEKETTTIINSHGLYCQQTDIRQSASIGIELVKDEDFLGIYEGEYTHTNIDLTRAISAIIQKLDWAKRNASPISGKIPILFTPEGASTLWETVSEVLNGKRILDHSSPWSDSMGEQVVSSSLSLSQQPERKPYDCPFDDEGTITQTLNLIDRGVLGHIYTDLKTAKKLGIPNTGNGFRPSLGSYPTPDLVNLVVASGNFSQNQLIQNLSSGIIIDQILGEGADISGDFSFNIDLGYLVQNGEITGRLKDTMVAGNVYEALNRVIALGSDRLWSGSCYTPSMLIDQLSVIAN